MTFPRIVVRGPNWLGDIVMALPALAAVRRAFPSSTLALAVPAPFAPVGRAIAGIDEVVPLAGTGVRHLRGHAAALAAGRFDLGILLTNSFASGLAVKLAGVPQRWGVRRDLRGPLLTRAVEPARVPADAAPAVPFPADHHAGYYLAVLRALDIAHVPGPFALTVEEDTRARAGTLLETGGRRANTPIVALAPGAAYGQAKRWPPERAAEAIVALADRGVQVVLVGAPSDRAASRAILSQLSTRPAVPVSPIDLVGRTTLAELMGVFSWSGAVVSNDSGAMHVAAGVGRPVVAIFGPTDERRTAPIGEHVVIKQDVWCRPCLLRECPIDHRCLRTLPASRIVEAVDGWLARPQGAMP